MIKRFAACAVSIAAACLPATAAGQAARDSSGVRIVENGSPAEAPEAWTVDEAQGVRLGADGAADGADEGEFVDVAGVVFLSGEGVAVADTRAAEIRRFNDDGELVGTFGRRGDGPGEFRDVGWIGECRDGLLDAYDRALGRLTVIAVEAMMVDAVQELLSASGTPLGSVRCVDGGWVGISSQMGAPPSSPGPVRWPVTVESHRRDGTGPGALLESQGDDRHWDPPQMGPLLLGRRTVLAASGTRIALGTQDGPQIAVYATSGELVQSIRWTGGDLRVPRGDVAEYVERWASSAGSEEAAQRIRATARDYPFPDAYPAFGDVLFDDQGGLWLESTRRVSRSRNMWTVFDRSGAMVGTVAFPRGLRLVAVDAAGGRAAAVRTDDVGFERVWILPLSQPSSPRGEGW